MRRSCITGAEPLPRPVLYLRQIFAETTLTLRSATICYLVSLFFVVAGCDGRRAPHPLGSELLDLLSISALNQPEDECSAADKLDDLHSILCKVLPPPIVPKIQRHHGRASAWVHIVANNPPPSRTLVPNQHLLDADTYTARNLHIPLGALLDATTRNLRRPRSPKELIPTKLQPESRRYVFATCCQSSATSGALALPKDMLVRVLGRLVVGFHPFLNRLLSLGVISRSTRQAPAGKRAYALSGGLPLPKNLR